MEGGRGGGSKEGEHEEVRVGRGKQEGVGKQEGEGENKGDGRGGVRWSRRK